MTDDEHAKLKAEHIAAMDKLIAEHAAAMEPARIAYQTALDEMGERYKLGIETQQKSHEQQLAAVAEQIDGHLKNFAAERATIHAGHQSELAVLRGQLDAQQENHAGELAAARAETADLALQLAETRARCEFEVAQHVLASQAALAILSEPAEARLLRAQHAQEVAALTAKHEADRQAVAAKLGR